MQRFFLATTAIVLACYTITMAQRLSLKPSHIRTANEKTAHGRFETYSVAFYSLDNLFDTINSNGKYDLSYSAQGRRAWNSVKYFSKINHIATAIAEMKSKSAPHGPAIIGICDVENADVVADIVSAKPLRERGLKFIHHDSPDRRGLDVALIYDPKAFIPTKVDNHCITSDEFPEFRTRDVMLISGLLGEEPVELIINHWPMPPSSSTKIKADLRENAATVVRAIVDSVSETNPDAGIIVMGNFNTSPSASNINKILNAIGNQEEMDENTLFNPFKALSDSGEGTCFWQDSWYLPDQILINYALTRNGTSALSMLRAKIFNADFLLTDDDKRIPAGTFIKDNWTDGYSNHLPVIAYFVKRKKQKD